jgi:formimidoylglutamate deiminase
MSASPQILAADWTWTGTRFEPGLAIRLAADGTIAGVEPLHPDQQNVVQLKGRALLPGFVDAHSHAFQRGLRSDAQRFDAGAGNFWTWRETMYRLAGSLDAERFYEISKQCFREMLRAGITSVGEFHYLHHAGVDYDDWAFDDAIISAAKDAGIRLVLIQTFYATGAINRPLEGTQRRFGPVSRDEFARQLDRLATKLESSTQTLALACHSIRAAGIEDLHYFRDYAARSKMPFHMHVEEARKEIEECTTAYGTNPLRLLLHRIRIDDRVTAIHCTHSNPEDLREWALCGGRICLCPITEGNLSDGFPNVPTMRDAGAQACIGSDCNIRISMAEELRWLEFAQRLRHERRGIVIDRSGSCADELFRIGTISGAQSIGLNAGKVQAGALADLISVDLTHESMRGCNENSILDSLIFGSGNGSIDQVWVGGIARPR